MKIRSRYLIYPIIILLLLGCTKKEDKINAQPKAEKTRENAEVKPHQVPSIPAKETEDKNMEQATKIMAQIHDYRERLDKNPKDLEALIVLGNVNYDMKRYDKAEELYVRALEIDPKNVFVRTDLASAYKYTGDVDKAVSELKKVLAQEQKHETALYNLGIILLNDKKDPDGAIKVWEEIISYNPNSEFSGKLKKKVAEVKKSEAAKKNRKE